MTYLYLARHRSGSRRSGVCASGGESVSPPVAEPSYILSCKGGIEIEVPMESGEQLPNGDFVLAFEEDESVIIEHFFIESIETGP
jgi:hypothetical protein